jgi:hypothetical protein
VREGAADIPAEVCERFGTSAKLTDEDRKAILDIASGVLAPFQREPAVKS